MIGSRHTFASYFAFAVDTILKVLWREGYARGPQELVSLTWNRIRRLERRFEALVARWRAGKLPAVGAGTVRLLTPHPDPPGQARWQSLTPPQGGRELVSAPRAPWPFPRGRGWVVRMLAPRTGPACVGTLCLAWEEAEMRAFHAAAPQVGRILRPLAHMIGAPVPEWLQLPKRRRVRKRKWWAEAHPTVRVRRDERAEMIVPNRRLAAREQAEDAVRRSEASGKPIDLRKFTPAAYGYFVHPPRDGNCPPPEIGYGGRWRPLPKDYVPPRDE